MADRFNPDDYVDVAARIREFYTQYPDGRLQTRSWQVVHVGNKDFVVAEAEAYRTSDDPHPGVGIAWEPIPGPTSFTKDSELQNAETSAWGRAIVALGFATRHIASREEVQNRRQEELPPPAALLAIRAFEAAMREHVAGMAAIERELGFKAENQADATAWWKGPALDEIERLLSKQTDPEGWVKAVIARAAGEPPEALA